MKPGYAFRTAAVLAISIPAGVLLAAATVASVGVFQWLGESCARAVDNLLRTVGL